MNKLQAFMLSLYYQYFAIISLKFKSKKKSVACSVLLHVYLIFKLSSNE